MDPNPDYDASDEIEHFFNRLHGPIRPCNRPLQWIGV
jgi:hypothetical protein